MNAVSLKINFGCGQTPTKEWRNFDNSFSLRLAKVPMLAYLLHSLGIIGKSLYEFIKFARENRIEHGDARKRMPLKNDSCEVVYTSHMLEHLDRDGALFF